MKSVEYYLTLALQTLTIVLLIILTCVVLLGVGFRYLGGSLIWYDEVASILLAWITFLGAALATLRNAHMAFSGIMYNLPLPFRAAVFGLVEAIVLASSAVMCWASWAVMAYFGSETLVSVPWMPRYVVQGVLPISLALIILARLVTLVDRWAEAKAGLSPEEKEIQAEIARSQAELSLQKEIKS